MEAWARAACWREVELAACGLGCGSGDRLRGVSYVLQKIRSGEPTCRCARAGGKLHGPFWYLCWKKDGKTKSRCVGKERPAKGLQRPGPQL